MSSDLATLFTGRTFCIDVYPFSFKEYLEYYQYNDIQEAFDNYVKEGGMSGSYLYKTQKEKYDYISDVYNTLIVRDINQKYKIRNIDVLNNYLMDNISNLTSSNNITNVLNNADITDKTISNYIKYLCNAFAFYKVTRYDIRGKNY
jgi:predicted AAA+ superfamily ATPase